MRNRETAGGMGDGRLISEERPGELCPKADTQYYVACYIFDRIPFMVEET
jgi:hypothetical protein